MQAVTHQINPHFMFNTLNTIRWLVKFGDENKAYEGITNFNRLMEAYMGKTGMMVPIREELDIIAKYTDILQLRYDLIFTLRTEVDPEALEFMIPRMFFQLIVENAIFHGIVPSGQNGEINITITDSPENIVVQISNNGIGIGDEQLECYPGYSIDATFPR